MFIIRKDKAGRISSSNGGMSLGLAFTIFGGVLSSFLLYSLYIEIKEGYHNYDSLLFLILPLTFLGIGLGVIKSELKIRKAKKFKENGNGILKQLPVTAIGYYYHEGGKNSKRYSGYYLEVETDDMIYCSDGFENASKTGMSKKEYKSIYKKYGFDFDEKYKDNVVRKLDEEIANRENDAENSWFLSKWFKNTFIVSTYKLQRDIIKEGYKPEKMLVNGHEVNVGDMVNVYIDPEDPQNYYVDVDYLKE